MASLSDFTNKEKFLELIRDIDENITSRNAYNLLVNNQSIQLSGGTVRQNTAKLNTGITKLDSIAKGIGELGNIVGSNIKGIENSLASKFDLNQPGIKVDLSSKGPAGARDVNLKQYTPPSSIVLDTFNRAGKSIDDWIKNSLELQTFPFKGTEMLCTGVCLLTSLLPCKVTNEIIDQIEDIKQMQNTVKLGLNSAIAAEKTALNSINCNLKGGVTGLANISNMKDTLNDVFKINKAGSKQEVISQNIKSITSQIATVTQVLNTVISVIKLGGTDPNAIRGFLVNGMFDIFENVMTALQAQAVQIADTILNKIIQPIEKLFKKNTFPAYCGISAQVMFRKILEIVYNFKDKMLKFIADIFSFESSARKKFELFNKRSLWTLELSMFLKVFDIILGDTLDIFIGCGITKRPCPGETDETLNQAYYSDTVFSEDSIYFSPPSKDRSSLIKEIPQDVALNEISKKFEPIISSMFTGNSDTKVFPGYSKSILKNVPSLIRSLLTDMNLGENTSLGFSGNDAVIIYNNKSLCGAN